MKKKILLIIVIILFYYFTKDLFMKNTFINPVTGKITSPFGELNKDLREHSHNGVDIGVYKAKIQSPDSGKILSIYERGSGGKQLRVLHDNGFITGYAHLSVNNLFKVGDKINKGDIIGITGNSGHSTGYHLHFTLTNDKGEKINPELYFNFKQ